MNVKQLEPSFSLLEWKIIDKPGEGTRLDSHLVIESSVFEKSLGTHV